ncbi:DUF4351 domain-containing protein [Candidatus Chloroploca sp. M-50]|uniref:DUF4351 domain-containing protein n=1 Tax=Candidatus Chloroploca mongolica TaxID=2528176 RepID=A0ABS4DDH5_9CHLR|nr:DUF4351 domain-containing protein [Candidatus Chloroploca mongolica]MBP1467499.1 DUF4351 domain-containing protein [Candidatus Chloroploca mongolica]
MELPPADFDGAWKYALDHYVAPLLELLFPEVWRTVDWQQPVIFRDTELHQLDPDVTRGKHRIDKLVQVQALDGSPRTIFIHLEVQAQRDATFAERMFCYHAQIFVRERRPVISLAVLSDDQPGWHPRSFGYAEAGCVVRLDFPTVKLLDLDLAMLEASRNPIAMVILIHRDPQATRGQPAERLRRKLARFRAFFDKGYSAADMRRLYRVLDQLLRLNPGMHATVRATMRLIEQEETQMDTFVTSIEELAFAEGVEKGVEKGIEQGRHQTLQEVVLRLLPRRCGPLPKSVHHHVLALSPEHLLDLSETLLDFTSLDDLQAWLTRTCPSG